ncbi:MAG TPA: hypothetical protein VJQ52_24630 [Steroidobacteraceae bacterium]|nr:hypothetical protein [Steroidobacteraceae bacterium]
MERPSSGSERLRAVATSACLGSFVLALLCVLAPQTGRAADEDSTTSVYLEFDPKTGDFKTVHDNDRSKQRAENQADDRSLLHPIAPDAAAGSASAATAAAPAAHASAQSGADSAGASTPLVVGAVAAVAVLLGIALAWFRRSERKAH